MGCCNSGAAPKGQAEPTTPSDHSTFCSEDTAARKKAAPTPRCSEATSDSITESISTVKEVDVVLQQQDELDQSPLSLNSSIVETIGAALQSTVVDESVQVPVQTLAPEPDQDSRYVEMSTKTLIPPAKKSSLPRRPSSCDISLQSYTESHTELFETLRKMEPMDNWVLKAQQDGVKIYVLHDGRDLPAFKAVAEVEMGSTEPADFLMKLLEVEKRPIWDDMCIKGTRLESYFPYYGISYVRIDRVAAIVQKRDLCLLGRTSLEESGAILVALHSIDHPDAPETSEFVRCEFICGGYILRPIPSSNNNAWQIIWTGKVNPRGWIPSWVVGLVAWKQGLTLVKFKTYFDKQKLQS